MTSAGMWFTATMTIIVMLQYASYSYASRACLDDFDRDSVIGKTVGVNELVAYTQVSVGDEPVSYSSSVASDVETLQDTLDGDDLFVWSAIPDADGEPLSGFVTRSELRSTRRSTQGIDDRGDDDEKDEEDDSEYDVGALRGDLCVWTPEGPLLCGDTDDSEMSQWTAVACTDDGEIISMVGAGVFATDSNDDDGDKTVVWSMSIRFAEEE